MENFEPIIETELGILANSLIKKAAQNQLKRSDLREFYHECKNNFSDIEKFSNCDEYKNVGALFSIMLEINNSDEDVEKRQSKSALGYYILSYGVYNKIFDNYGNIKPDKLLDYIQLLKFRLFLLLNSKDNMKYTISKIPNRPTDKYWSPLSDSYNSYNAEMDSYVAMTISDAGEIKRIGSQYIAFFEQEAVNLATGIINNNSYQLKNSSIEDKIAEGKTEHRLLFQYLDNKFRVNHSFKFK